MNKTAQRQRQRIAKIRARIRVCDEMIDRWLNVAHYTTEKSTHAKAVRKVEMYEDRRDLWEGRLVTAELGALKVYSRY